MATSVLDENRRLNRDRRRTPTRPYSLYSLRGRRRHKRRHAEIVKGYYVDRYESRWLVAAAGIMMLGCIDAWATLHLLQHGARETNPLMRMLLGRNTGLFLAVKLAVTGAGVMLMCSHHKFDVLRGLTGSRLLLISLVVYTVLVGYELRTLL